MNIKSEDYLLFEKLKSATLAKVVVGSRMYGTETESSDTDYLYIYATSENELLSAIQSHHQIQFVKDNNDHNFVSLHTFLRNCISGDSTINFETIISGALDDTPLQWLSDIKESFITYTIIRSYLGFARRDIKHFHKYNDTYNREKRLRHIIRGNIYARTMLDHIFDFESANKELKMVELDVSTNIQLRVYEQNISYLRKLLNKKFDDKTLNYPQHIGVSEGIEMTRLLLDFCKSDYYKEKQAMLTDFDMSKYINSYENWVRYD